MESLISPIAPLPQSSFIEYIPLQTPKLDIQSIYNMENDRQNAITENKRYLENLKLGTLASIGSQQAEMSKLGIASENPWQLQVADNLTNSFTEASTKVASLLNDDFDPIAVNKELLALQGGILNNNEYKNSIAQQKRHANIVKGFTANPGRYNQYKIDEYLQAYQNYDGTNEDPTLTFNPASAMLYDYNTDYKWIESLMPTQQTEVEPGVLGYEYGTVDSILKRINQQWQQQGQYSGINEDEWKENMFNTYFTGGEFKKRSDGTVYKVIKTAYKNSGASNSDGKTGETSSGLYKGSEIDIDNFGLTVNQDKIGDFRDKLYSGTFNQGDLLLEDPKLYKEKINQARAAYLNDRNELTKQIRELNKIPPDSQTPEQKEKYIQLNQAISDINSMMADLNNLQKESVKLDESFRFENVNKAIFNSDNPNPFKNTPISNGQIINEKISKILNTPKLEKLLGSLRVKYSMRNEGKTIKQFISEIDELKRNNSKDPDVILALDKIEQEVIKLAPETAYKNVNNSMGAKYNKYSFEVDGRDIDYKDAISKYLGSGNKTYDISNKSEGVYNATTKTKFKVSAVDDANASRINFTGIEFDNNSGTFGIRGTMGIPEVKDDKSNEFIKTEDGNYQFKNKSQEVWIKDSNVNIATLRSLYENNPYLAELASEVIPEIYKKIKIKEGLSTMYGKYKITNVGNGKVTVSKNGVPISVKGETEISDFKVPYAIALDQLPESQAATSNNSSYTPTYTKSSNGGASSTMGKSQENSQQIFNNFKDLVHNVETNGFDIKSSYAAIGTAGSPDLGRYQFNPNSHSKAIDEFVKNNKSLISTGYDEQSMVTRYSEPYSKFINTLNKYGKYNSSELVSMFQFLNSPQLQESYMDKIEKEYAKNIDIVQNKYQQRGISLTDDQAMYAIHHHGLGGALKAKPFSEVQKKRMGLINSNLYNPSLQFQPNIKSSFEKVKPNLQTGVSKLIEKLNLQNYVEISSALRKGDSGAHGSGDAVDIVQPMNKRSEKDDMEFISQIASLFGTDKDKAFNMLWAGRGTDGKNIKPVILNHNGQKLKLIYHKNKNSPGNHLHIKIE